MKKEGETIKAGDVIAEIETDKATMEVEAVDEGVLGKILVEDGTANIAVNAPIAVLVEDGETVPSEAPAASGPRPATAEPAARKAPEVAAPAAARGNGQAAGAGGERSRAEPASGFSPLLWRAGWHSRPGSTCRG